MISQRSKIVQWKEMTASTFDKHQTAPPVVSELDYLTKMKPYQPPKMPLKKIKTVNSKHIKVKTAIDKQNLEHLADIRYQMALMKAMKGAERDCDFFQYYESA